MNIVFILPTDPQPALRSGGLPNVWSTGTECHRAEHPSRGCTSDAAGVEPRALWLCHVPHHPEETGPVDFGRGPSQLKCQL